MEDALFRFEKRCHTVRRNHRRLARGYTTKLDRSGVIRHEPDTARGDAPLRVLTVMLVGVLGLKAFLIAGLGPEAYAEKHAQLAKGSEVDRAGAIILQMGPVSTRAAGLVGPFLR